MRIIRENPDTWVRIKDNEKRIQQKTKGLNITRFQRSSDRQTNLVQRPLSGHKDDIWPNSINNYIGLFGFAFANLICIRAVLAYRLPHLVTIQSHYGVKKKKEFCNQSLHSSSWK